MGKIAKTTISLMIGIAVVAYYAFEEVTIGNGLARKVEVLMNLDFLESKRAYLFLHFFTVIPVFLLSFDKKVAYYKTWKRLWLPILVVGIFFILWDVFFTLKGVWGFNSRYLTGINLWNLPIEEVLFFITVPFACVFIHECLNRYFPGNFLGKSELLLTNILIIIFFVVAFFSFEKAYTFATFFLTGLFLVIHRWWFPSEFRERFYFTYLVSLIPFLLVNGVLTGSFTEEPIVLYNEAEFLGVRIFSIPIEDSIYGFLLLMLVVSGFQKRQTNMN